MLLWHCDLRFSCVPQHAPKHDGLSRRWQSSSKSPLHHSTLIPGTIFGRCLMFLLKLLGHVRFKRKSKKCLIYILIYFDTILRSKTCQMGWHFGMLPPATLESQCLWIHLWESPHRDLDASWPEPKHASGVLTKKVSTCGWCSGVGLRAGWSFKRIEMLRKVELNRG